MSISELIKHVGDENIVFQNLQASLAMVDNGKKDSRITFFTATDKGQDLTNAVVSESKTKFVGLIVWLPRAKLPSEMQ